MEPMKVHGLHKMTKKEKPKRLKFSKELFRPSILIDIHMNFPEDKDNELE
jgi:hypothetical protein